MDLDLVYVVVVVLLLLVASKWALFPARKMPPGPRPWPIIGNMLLLKQGSVAEVCRKLSKDYGPFITFWVGCTPCIIVMQAEVAHEALVEKAAFFHSRPMFPSSRSLSHYGRGLTTAFGMRWKFLRKLLVTEVLANSRVQSYKPVRSREVEILVESIMQQVQGNSAFAIGIRKCIRCTIFNILLGIYLGKRFEEAEFDKLDHFLEAKFRRAGGQPRDHIPLLKLLPNTRNTRENHSINNAINTILAPLILERRKEFFNNSPSEAFSGIVDTLIDLQRQNSARPVEEAITDEDIVLLVVEALNAGIDTSSVNLEYSLANAVLQPNLQDKLWEEMERVVGSDRRVAEDDIPNLPLLQSVVKEALRLHPPAAIIPGRIASQDCKLAGYDIPSGAILFTHVEAIGSDPRIWDNPTEFQPERFLNKKVDITGSSEVTMIPFGAGRRICPAANIAFLHAHFLLARLIQSFEFTAAQPVDLTPSYGFTCPMKYPLKLHARPRTPTAA